MASVAPSCLTASVDAGSLSWDAPPVGFPSIFVLALGLSMDAMAVAAARGLATPHVRGRHVAQIALFFGGFQALMPLLGWMIGASLGEHVRAWDHWIAFVLLCAIGLKMLWDARPGAPEPDEEAAPSDAFAPRVLLVLAIATSIDALAAGVTLPMLEAPMLLSLVTIGLTTAVLSAVGLLVGRRFGAMLGKRLDVIGGLALMGLGTKILIEHLGGAG